MNRKEPKLDQQKETSTKNTTFYNSSMTKSPKATGVPKLRRAKKFKPAASRMQFWTATKVLIASNRETKILVCSSHRIFPAMRAAKDLFCLLLSLAYEIPMFGQYIVFLHSFQFLGLNRVARNFTRSNLTIHRKSLDIPAQGCRNPGGWRGYIPPNNLTVSPQ